MVLVGAMTGLRHDGCLKNIYNTPEVVKAYLVGYCSTVSRLLGIARYHFDASRALSRQDLISPKSLRCESRKINGMDRDLYVESKP